MALTTFAVWERLPHCGREGKQGNEKSGRLRAFKCPILELQSGEATVRCAISQPTTNPARLPHDSGMVPAGR